MGAGPLVNINSDLSANTPFSPQAGVKLEEMRHKLEMENIQLQSKSCALLLHQTQKYTVFTLMVNGFGFWFASTWLVCADRLAFSM